MEISKKDLLALTGISYGQLYRWKREGLIPEEWFRKRPAKTGQETFLPRELILERIQFILGHKDSCTIEEMAELLRTNRQEAEFTAEMMAKVPGIHADIRRAIADNACSRTEVALLVIASRLYEKYHLTLQEVAELLSGCANMVAKKPEGRHDLLAVRISGKLFGLLVPEGVELAADRRMSVLERFQVDSIAQDLVMKYLNQ